MIVKDLKPSIHLQILEAINKRLLSGHPNQSKIEEDLAIRRAGYRGEKEVAFQLELFSQEKYKIFYDLRLNDGNHFFQIDALILSRNFALILEVKNMSGTIVFDPIFQQFYRVKDEEEKAYLDPISQVERQKLQLIKWLHTHQLPQVPIETFVVIAKPQTIIKTTSNPEEISKKVIHSASLHGKLHLFHENYQTEIMSEGELTQLTRQLLKKHTPQFPKLLQKYAISQNHLQKGVICPNCSSIPMKREHGKWRCLACRHTSKDAHLDALKDYYLLFGSEITNQKLRSFLLLPSTSVAAKVLHAMKIPYKGEGRRRIYFLSID
ncbi:nuclease-related domain-containing protein [Bacillus sp. 03113]|uniref:nuclease-related domain-containing protein n=1 Tax=Bacillus sp. 03113 TaxID=2578211 RepID=UPI001143339F|nr:nuclease-related domain-containing protein [Bacillus sp. 03113]